MATCDQCGGANAHTIVSNGVICGGCAINNHVSLVKGGFYHQTINVEFPTFTQADLDEFAESNWVDPMEVEEPKLD